VDYFCEDMVAPFLISCNHWYQSTELSNNFSAAEAAEKIRKQVQLLLQKVSKSLLHQFLCKYPNFIIRVKILKTSFAYVPGLLFEPFFGAINLK
jgi:hypothetical protein